MGYRISWLAAKDVPADWLLDHFGLASTGEPDEANEAPFSISELPTGWTVLWSNDPTYASIARCQPLSVRTPVVSCQVNETVMLSSSNYFEDGEYRWFIGHDSQEGMVDLQFEGNLPDVFPSIRTRLTDLQAAEGGENAEVDFFFDIPLEVAESICGYKHDKWEFEWGEPRFFAARAPIPPPAEVTKGWLGRLFPRR